MNRWGTLPALFNDMTIKSFRDLLVWQNAMTLAEGVYEIAGTLPASERYGLSTQLRRAAVSIASNIAEGRGRGQTGSFINHLLIALGSEAELQTQLELAVRLRMVPRDRAQTLIDSAAQVGRMLRGLVASLEARAEDNRQG
jgi:four helix bundle protein